MGEAGGLMLLKYVEFRQVDHHCKVQNIANLANSNYDLTSHNQHCRLVPIKEKEMNAMQMFHEIVFTAECEPNSMAFSQGGNPYVCSMCSYAIIS